MKTYSKYLKVIPIFLLMLLASLGASSQGRDLKDYCIVAYANPANTNFKTPFIYNFGENYTFEYLDVEGKLYKGKYSVINGRLKFIYESGGEENYQIKDETIIPPVKKTSALLVKKVNGNLLKGKRYTGILYNSHKATAVRTTYQFIANKFGVSDENSKGKGVPFNDYILVGNMAGYKWYGGPGGIKSLLSRRVFVLYGTQLVVINIYKNNNENTYGVLDQEFKN